MLLDGNKQPFQALDSFNSLKSDLPTFDGETDDARGNKNGANNPRPVFTVTGTVETRIWGVCSQSLITSGSVSISLGISDDPILFIVLTTASNITANSIWNDNSPTVGDTLANIAGPFVILDGEAATEVVGGALGNISTGNIYYICLWRPLSPDGLVRQA